MQLEARSVSTPAMWRALFVLCLGSFAILLDMTIVNVAVPSMLDALHAGLDDVLWVLNAYLLAFAVLLITAGRLGDVFGQRTLFVTGLAVFTVASAACGLAPNSAALIGARVLQGVGAALLTPQALAIIMATFPAQRRGAALGILAGISGLASVSGPSLGGVIVTYVDWRWIFFINLPIGLVAIVLSFLWVPAVRTGRRHRLDLVGVVLGTAGLLAILFGLIEGQRYEWGTVAGGVTIPEILGAGAVLIAAFLLWERVRPQALLPLGLFRSRNFAVWTALTAAPWFALSGFLLTITINNQTVLGMSAVQAGLTSLPMTIVLAAVAPLSGRLTDRVGGKYLVVAGLLLFATGIVLVGLVDWTGATSLTFTAPLAVAGLGMGLVFAPLTTEALRDVAPAMAGAASGVLSTTRQLGSALGGAVVGAVLWNQLAGALHTRAVSASSQLPPPARRPFVDGFAGAVRGGLQVGRGESGGAQVPPGLPAPLADQLRALIHEVFVNAFVAAVRPTLAVAAAGPVLGALACLVLVRRRQSSEDIA
jgi:EmrB/QacA subfamily drug resistance transporter